MLAHSRELEVSQACHSITPFARLALVAMVITLGGSMHGLSAEGAMREGITKLSKSEMAGLVGGTLIANKLKCIPYGGGWCGTAQVPGQGEDACEEAGACVGPGDACGFGTVSGPSKNDICVKAKITDNCILGVGWCQEIRRHICETVWIPDSYICLCVPDPDEDIEDEQIGNRNYCLAQI